MPQAGRQTGEDELIQHTDWGPDLTKGVGVGWMHTQYGYIPYHRWLTLEAERIGVCEGRVAEVRRRASGQYALFVNAVSDQPTYAPEDQNPHARTHKDTHKRSTHKDTRARTQETTVDNECTSGKKQKTNASDG